MLKIKNNVDLSILEKYGFEYNGLVYCKYVKNSMALAMFVSKNNNNLIFINYEKYKQNNFISGKKDFVFAVENTLFDLIQADLVEKVME